MCRVLGDGAAVSIATPSKRRVDGVEVDAKNQYERAVKFDVHTGLDNRRLHVGRLWGPGLVGLLAVLLHLDGAAGGLGRGVGDRLLLNPRLRPPVVLLAREAAGGDGAADAAERQDDEEYDDDSDAASAAGMAIILGLVFQAPLDAVVADLPGFAPVGIDR